MPMWDDVNNPYRNSPNPGRRDSADFPRPRFDKRNDMWAEDYAIAEGFLATAIVKAELPNTLIHHKWDENGHLVLTVELTDLDAAKDFLRSKNYNASKGMLKAVMDMQRDITFLEYQYQHPTFEFVWTTFKMWLKTKLVRQSKQ